MAVSGTEEIDILALDEALNALTKKSERRARVVELRFFAGLEFEEIAEVLGTSRKTAEADWYAARAWLHRELSKE